MKEAVGKFKSALDVNSNHPETLHQWGLVLMKSKDKISLERARSKLWEARTSLFAKENKNKLASSILTDLAFVLEELDHDLAAAYCLKEAVLFNTNNAKAFWKLGEVLEKTDGYEESQSSFESAFQLDPHNAEGLAAWGKALFRRSQIERDVQKRALLQEETQRKCDEALQACNPEEQHATAATALHFLGEVLNEKKRFKEAIQKFQEANDLEEDYWTICQWSLALSELKRDEEAVEKLDGLHCELHDGDELKSKAKADVLKTLATVRKKQGKQDAANKAFREASNLYKSAGHSAEAHECADLASTSPAGFSPTGPTGSSHDSEKLRRKRRRDRSRSLRRRY